MNDAGHLLALDRSGLDPNQWFALPEGVGPYPGFVAFEERDASVFFGRDQEITSYLEELNLLKAPDRAQALVISGGSGSCKSSLMKAGLIPRLRQQPDWVIIPPLAKAYGCDPRVMITDKLRSYGAAAKDIMPDVDHRQHKGLNNRAEASHKATRRRERVMQRFKSPHHAQRFCAAHDQINTLFRPHRHHLSKASYRHARHDAFDLWETSSEELIVA